MKKEFTFKQTLGIFLVFLFFLFLVHEGVHYETAKEYGCENVSIQPYPSGNAFMSTNYDCQHLDKYTQWQHKQAQANVELVGYHVIAATTVILIAQILKL